MKSIILLILFSVACSHSPEKVTKADPLPSWNDGEVKQSIINYVKMINKKESPDFIPLEDRIATFDNDGTLWSEKPDIQLIFAEWMAKKRSIKHKPLEKMNEKEAIGFIVQTHTGMTDEEFAQNVDEFFAEVKHPQFNVPFRETTYKPQIELIQYLQQNGFRVYICSGGTVDLMREISQDYYGVPPEQVIGTNFQYSYSEKLNTLKRDPKLEVFNDKQMKPVTIHKAIGKRPVFASGNVRSGGDVYMLRYSQGSPHPNFQLMINHDDADREHAYVEKDGISLKWAKEYKWNVVSIKNDWKNVFYKTEKVQK